MLFAIRAGSDRIGKIGEMLAHSLRCVVSVASRDRGADIPVDYTMPREEWRLAGSIESRFSWYSASAS